TGRWWGIQALFDTVETYFTNIESGAPSFFLAAAAKKLTGFESFTRGSGNILKLRRFIPVIIATLVLGIRWFFPGR
ncbi:MAG: hypothetical protein ABW168_14285, partial [Sedimenticola sp.]